MDLVDTGYGQLYLYDPRSAADGKQPFRLVSRAPSKNFDEIALKEGRYAVLSKVNPEGSKELMVQAQKDIDERWSLYQEFTELDRIHIEDEEE